MADSRCIDDRPAICGRESIPRSGAERAGAFPKPNMNPYIETMFVLQRRILSGSTTGIDKLRSQVPAPVLDHFDRMTAQGRKGVAQVNHGVCGACHLRLPVATVMPGAEHEDLEICENCGAYLIFPTEETPVAAPVVRKRRRATAVLT